MSQTGDDSIFAHGGGGLGGGGARERESERARAAPPDGYDSNKVRHGMVVPLARRTTRLVSYNDHEKVSRALCGCVVEAWQAFRHSLLNIIGNRHTSPIDS